MPNMPSCFSPRRPRAEIANPLLCWECSFLCLCVCVFFCGGRGGGGGRRREGSLKSQSRRVFARVGIYHFSTRMALFQLRALGGPPGATGEPREVCQEPGPAVSRDVIPDQKGHIVLLFFSGSSAAFSLTLFSTSSCFDVLPGGGGLSLAQHS